MQGVIFDLFDTLVLSGGFVALVERLFPGVEHQRICDVIYTQRFGSPVLCVNAVVHKLGLQERIPIGQRRAVAEEFSRWAATRPLKPGVREVLTILRRRGFRLALLSNTSELLDPTLDVHRLLGYFDVAHLSFLTSNEKPRPEAFIGCLHDLRLQSQDVVMIGDSVHADIEGARGVGMRAIHMDWKNERTQEPRVASLLELLNLPEFQHPE